MSKGYLFNKWITAVLLSIQSLLSFYYVTEMSDDTSMCLDIYIRLQQNLNSKPCEHPNPSSIISANSWESFGLMRTSGINLDFLS